MCTFLKSRLESVRRVTRETLQKIMLTLGPKYLGILLHEMSVMLTRGYQVHVLIYTIHAVLVSLKNLFQPGDIDCNLQAILEVSKLAHYCYILMTENLKPTKPSSVLEVISNFFFLLLILQDLFWNSVRAPPDIITLTFLLY